MEIWKPVKGYEGLYEVSSEGRVRSLDKVCAVRRGNVEMEIPHKGKVLKPVIRQHGYLGVMLYGKGGHKSRGFKTFSIHRLVAEAFIPNPDGLPEVNHLDENKTNNRMENLAWISHIDNTNYGTGQARRAIQAVNGSKSRKIAQYTMNGDLIKVFPSLAEAERKTGYAKANICRCAQGSEKYSHAYGYKWQYAS